MTISFSSTKSTQSAALYCFVVAAALCTALGAAVLWALHALLLPCFGYCPALAIAMPCYGYCAATCYCVAVLALLVMDCCKAKV